jgi:hypothetical protein
MYNLETLLSISKKRDNSNKKFPNSTNKLVYDRLQINFSFPDPNVLVLSDSAKEHLNNMPKFIKDWQAEDMRNANVKDYYKNPLYSSSIMLHNISRSIINLISVENTSEYNPFLADRAIVTGLENVYFAASNLLSSSCDFLCHTNRLSNVVPVYGECGCGIVANTEDPHYITCSALNRTILYLVHEIDGISDARPLLGCFTSLFVLNSVNDYVSKITPHVDTIKDSLIYLPEGITTTLTSSESSAIASDLNSAAYMLHDRVEHDKRVWRNMKMLNEEQTVFKLMNGMGQTQNMLVQSYIGTEKLKTSLLIEDLPSIKYDVTIDYFGNTILKPNVFWTMPPNSNVPLYIPEDYINYYTNNKIEIKYPPIVVDDGSSGGSSNGSSNVIFTLDVFPGALIFNTENGLWSSNQTITITNTGNTAYTISNVDFDNFSKTEFSYEFNPANTNIIGVGNSAQFIVSARATENEDFIEYGYIKIVPGIDIATKIINSFDDIGVITPLSIINIYGSSSEKLILNSNNGPYKILSDTSSQYNEYTWINESDYTATISTLENITDSANLADMTIYLINANTPATLNVSEKVLWYANVVPHVSSPNNFTYKITTENGQERTLVLGVYGGNNGTNGGIAGDGVDDSVLYNETLNTVPDLIIANGQSFVINVSNGKPRTAFTYSGPDLTGSAYLDANGNYSLENSDGITSNGYYTYIFTFDGTDRTRTITKAIFT